MVRERKGFHQDDYWQVICPGGRNTLSGNFKEVSKNG